MSNNIYSSKPRKFHDDFVSISNIFVHETTTKKKLNRVHNIIIAAAVVVRFSHVMSFRIRMARKGNSMKTHISQSATCFIVQPSRVMLVCVHSCWKCE